MLFRIFAFLGFLNVIREIKIYSDYRSIIRKERLNSPLWTKFKLRYDWIGRIYTVVNLPPEVTMSRDFPQDARPAFVFEEIKVVNDYLTTLNLQEVVTPSLQPIEETDGDSYLVVYYFFFRELSWFWLLRFFLEIALAGFITSNWSWITNYLGF
jgi:hypothetical protein